MKNVNYNKIAKKVIETEINSLKKLKSNLNISFERAVKTILSCKSGKIIISGVGKSGIIGKKIASTLSSVGTPSFFVDASSCSHGDLGQIGFNDVLILISYSGESSELKNIIQYAKRNKISLIGIMSKKKSLLYKASDIKILIPEVKEADPNNIVPTSSTIIQLSIGDALAVATMKSRKFTKLDFKKFHPSGSLGAKLKTVEDLMLTGNKIPFVNENILMKYALNLLFSLQGQLYFFQMFVNPEVMISHSPSQMLRNYINILIHIRLSLSLKYMSNSLLVHVYHIPQKVRYNFSSMLLLERLHSR